MTRVAFEGVTKRFDDAIAVAGVHFTVEPGSLGVIVGPSGCGKSTLLSLAAGLDHPTTGYVFVSGREVAGIANSVALIFQHHNLFDWETVEGNVAFGLEMRGASRRRARVRARELLADVGLGRYAGHVPAELSGGMRQRVALVRVIAMQPKVILLDEPFAALDYQTRRMMQDYLLNTRKQTGATILLVTHDLSEAVRLADRLILFSGSPGTVRDVIDIEAPHPRDLSHPTLCGLVQELELHLRTQVAEQEFTPEERVKFLELP